MTDHPKKNRRAKLMSALFAEAAKYGVDTEQLRNKIAPERLKKRLSAASEQEIERLLGELFGKRPRTHPHPGPLPEGEGGHDRPLMSGFKERYDELGRREGMATPLQLRKIEVMWMSVSRMPNYAARERALQGFLKRIAGVDNMRFIEGWMVQKIIRAISAMQRPKAATKAPRHEEKQNNEFPF